MSRLAFILIALAALVQTAKVPKTWKICRRSDKNLNDCLKVATQKAVSDLKDGNPQLGVLPLEPMRFDKLVLDQGNGPVSIKLDFKDLDLNGISSAHVERIKADWNNYYLEGDISFTKKVYLLGDYKISGKVILLPITGAGKCNLTFDNFVAKLTIKGHEVLKGKQKHMQVDKFTVNIETSRLHINLENLFNGDKALALFYCQINQRIGSVGIKTIKEFKDLIERAGRDEAHEKIKLNRTKGQQDPHRTIDREN